MVVVSQPVWLRSPRQVSAEEYQEFYRTTFRMYDEPLNHTHFSLEGQVRPSGRLRRIKPGQQGPWLAG